MEKILCFRVPTHLLKWDFGEMQKLENFVLCFSFYKEMANNKFLMSSAVKYKKIKLFKKLLKR